MIQHESHLSSPGDGRLGGSPSVRHEASFRRTAERFGTPFFRARLRHLVQQRGGCSLGAKRGRVVVKTNDEDKKKRKKRETNMPEMSRNGWSHPPTNKHTSTQTDKHDRCRLYVCVFCVQSTAWWGSRNKGNRGRGVKAGAVALIGRRQRYGIRI